MGSKGPGLGLALAIGIGACGHASEYVPRGTHQAFLVRQGPRLRLVVNEMPYDTLHLADTFACTAEDLARATRALDGRQDPRKLDRLRDDVSHPEPVLAVQVLHEVDGELVPRPTRLLVLREPGNRFVRGAQNVMRAYNDLLQCRRRLDGGTQP